MNPYGNLKDKEPDIRGRRSSVRYASSMEKKPKCKCRKMDLPQSGRVVIRCAEHLGKPSKSGRLVCYFDADGIVRRESERLAELVAQSRGEGHECVYFARLGDLIKIGISKDPDRRADQLNATILLVLEGGRKLEVALHKEFARLRVRGEWFRAEPELLARIEELSAE